MATRRDIREAFYAELETAASGHVTASSIGQDHPNSDEDLPAIVHNDDYRHVPMNRSASPTRVTTDTDGEQTYTYSRIVQAQFLVTIVSDDEQEKEDAYEAVRSYFEPYSTPVKDASSLQTDAFRIEVEDATSRDFTDREPASRGDSLAINISFERLYDTDVDPTTTVEQNVDGDNDGTIDETYTTS